MDNERRIVPAFVKIDGTWVRVGTANQSRANPFDVKLIIDADLETARGAVEALMQNRLAPIGFGPEPPEPHDDEYKPRQPVINFNFDPPSVTPVLPRRPPREAWPV